VSCLQARERGFDQLGLIDKAHLQQEALKDVQSGSVYKVVEQIWVGYQFLIKNCSKSQMILKVGEVNKDKLFPVNQTK
jgi:hypothetical protein